MINGFEKFKPGQIKLLPGILTERENLNREYMLSLKSEYLLQNYYFEAGILNIKDNDINNRMHSGWELPASQLRGHFLGHYLSAAAKMYASKKDYEIKAKADYIVSELERCQKKNGGEWAGSIPEKYLYWIAKGEKIWAPQYTIHKTMMGLWDMYKFAESKQAFEILISWSNWFYRWTSKYSKDEMKKIMATETGGMLEIWANLYDVTKDEKHLELLNRYYNTSLFDKLLSKKDVLTNKHANTMIPEIIGAARAYEVTKEEKWRKIVEAFWENAVVNRGYFCTGGQTAGEMWTSPYSFLSRLGTKNQEHCTVYNMMRLSDILLQWTKKAAFADYWERNLYNGILAQQNYKTGMVAYYMPLSAGDKKKWGSRTEDFWCCHGTLVQAHSEHGHNAFLKEGKNLIINQYIPSYVKYSVDGVIVKAKQKYDTQLDSIKRPEKDVIDIEIDTEKAIKFKLNIRIPWWAEGNNLVYVNEKQVDVTTTPSSYLEIEKDWKSDKVRVELAKPLYTCPLPDEQNIVAFMNGPVVLAGLCNEERAIKGDKNNPYTMLAPDDERDAYLWLKGYKTKHQDFGFRFLPLYEVTDERYQVYFEVLEK